jgi:hypothetical protein
MIGVVTAGQYASSHKDLSRGTRVPSDNRSNQATFMLLSCNEWMQLHETTAIAGAYHSFHRSFLRTAAMRISPTQFNISNPLQAIAQATVAGVLLAQ